MEQIISMLLYFCAIGFLLYFIGLLGYSMLKGAPYAAVGTERLTTMIELASIKKGEKVVDLESGDGRIVAACAKVGAQAYGYEINPILVFISRRLLKRNEIKIAHIYQRSYWNADLSQFQVVTLYGTTHIMNGF
jgi:predicted RNA methylase